jgi:putative SOS response-associated peptidase YedK
MITPNSGRCAHDHRVRAGRDSLGYVCGRYASVRTSLDLSSLFDAFDETDGALVPDYNVAPTDPVPIVRHTARLEQRVLSVARWGFVPAWAPDTSGAARMINARAETVATSRAFGRAFAEHRCLVPAEGWYEWMRREKAKQAYFMTLRDGGPLAFGGLWSAFSTPSGRLLTFSILTLPSEGELARVHDRMPLVVEPSRWQEWLASPDVTGLLRAPATEFLAGIEVRPVSAAVGDVRNDGPQLIELSTVEPTLF